MAEKLSPEAQQAFNLNRGIQIAIEERDNAAVAKLQKRAAELALEFAKEEDGDKELLALAKAAVKDPGDTGEEESVTPGDSEAVTEKSKETNQG